MKPSMKKNAVVGVSLVFVTCITCLTAWSPPDPENDGESIDVPYGGIKASAAIQIKSPSPAGMPENIIAPDAAAVVAGYGNDLVRTGSTADKGSGLIVGNSNIASSMGSANGPQPIGIIGSANNVRCFSSLIVGSGNNVATDATTLVNSARFTAVFGLQNTVARNAYCSVISGSNNTVSARYALVTGQGNTVEGSTVGYPTNVSAAIGAMNHIMSNNSWTMGSSNEVSADLATALGVGLVADSYCCTFVGAVNAPVNGSLTSMRAEDPVFVVGNGTDANNRSNALIVKRNGDIIITKPQGDISMGDYQ